MLNTTCDGGPTTDCPVSAIFCVAVELRELSVTVTEPLAEPSDDGSIRKVRSQTPPLVSDVEFVHQALSCCCV